MDESLLNGLKLNDEEGDGNIAVTDNFGIMLRHFRTKVKNLTLKELEEISGISASYICRLENGEKKSPTITIILQLAEALNIPNSVLVATLIKKPSQNEGKATLAEVLIKNDYIIHNRLLNKEAKENLIRLLEFITEAEWTPSSKVRELYQLSEIIDQLKEAM
jgi:transcriptional regulator with XRE-family HTH domain